jgi:hypothetical protein
VNLVERKTSRKMAPRRFARVQLVTHDRTRMDSKVDSMMDSILGSAQEETAVLAGRRFEATRAHQDGVTRKLQ